DVMRSPEVIGAENVLHAYKRGAPAQQPTEHPPCEGVQVDARDKIIADLKFRKREIETRVSDLSNTLASLRADTVAQPVQKPVADCWQPIETAPKDGTYILLSNNECGGSWVGHFKEHAQSGFRFENPWHSQMLNHWHLPNKDKAGLPTHWMPMPAAPLS